MSNIVAIAAIEAASEVERLGDDASLEDRLLAAMRSTRQSWCATNENEQYLAACEAVYKTASDDERERIKTDLEETRRANAMLNALTAGVPVDLDQMLADKEAREAEGGPEPIGIQKLWRRVVDEKS